MTLSLKKINYSYSMDPNFKCEMLKMHTNPSQNSQILKNFCIRNIKKSCKQHT